MSTTDLDRLSPVDRFLARTPVPDRAAEAAAPDRVSAATGAARTAGAAGVRGLDRRARARAAMLGAAPTTAGPAAVRLAGAADEATLRALAQADPAGRPPAAPVLLAEADGLPVAAIGVLDRRVLAAPGDDAAAAVELLQARAAELRGTLRRARWAARLGRGRRG